MIHSKMRSKCGFTLIELLVVIAIIAILAAILFPVFAGARAKASQTECLSNIKQIGYAFQMYANDYNEMLPFIYSWTYGWNTNLPLTKSWMASLMDALDPYIKDTVAISSVWHCSEDPWDLNRPVDEDWLPSYSYCVQWNSTPDGGGGLMGDPLCPELGSWGGFFSGIRPTEQCLMIDNGLTSEPSTDPADYETPHAGGTVSNIVFWDGHAKSIPADQFGSIHPPLLLE